MHFLRNTSYKSLELIVLFFLVPLSLFFDFHVVLKALLVLSAVIYVIVVSIKLKLFKRNDLLAFKGFSYWKVILLIFSCVALASYMYILKAHPKKLFIVIKQAPLFWLGLTLFYSIFSVYPQEFLYRSYFFRRYGELANPSILVGLNIIAFPLAHLFFHSWMVLGITFIGGIFFTLSYLKTKSLLLTTVEHALYGSWLFTIGMGEMLGFPLPQ